MKHFNFRIKNHLPAILNYNSKWGDDMLLDMAITLLDKLEKELREAEPEKRTIL